MDGDYTYDNDDDNDDNDFMMTMIRNTLFEWVSRRISIPLFYRDHCIFTVFSASQSGSPIAHGHLSTG